MQIATPTEDAMAISVAMIAAALIAMDAREAMDSSVMAVAVVVAAAAAAAAVVVTVIIIGVVMVVEMIDGIATESLLRNRLDR